MHDVRRIVDETTATGLVPWVTCLTPLPGRQHDVDLLGRVMVVWIHRMRCHKADTDTDVGPYLETVRTGDGGVGMVAQEPLVLRHDAGPGFPMELPLDGGKGIGE